MKYLKLAIAGVLGAAMLYSCDKDENPEFGPGTAEVGFAETTLTISETEGLVSLPLELTGEPGGYPVTVNISASGVDNIDDVLLITSTTIKITPDNDSFVQMTPVWNEDVNESYTITLTIDSANGAAIGANNTCTITIENMLGVRTGQYLFTAQSGSPSDWNLVLETGSNGTYIMSNMFNLDNSPRLVGEFDAENMQLRFEGEVNGLGNVGNGSAYEFPVGSGAYYAMSGFPIVFNVEDNAGSIELASSASSFTFYGLEVDLIAGTVVDQIALGVFSGGICEYAGDAGESIWPF